jgi:hypothetical protein
MYEALIDGALTEEEVVAIVGRDLVDKILTMHCTFTGRVIDECFGCEEMIASVEVIIDDCERVLTCHYLIDTDDLRDAGDDLGELDYSNYYFTID